MEPIRRIRGWFTAHLRAVTEPKTNGKRSISEADEYLKEIKRCRKSIEDTLNSISTDTEALKEFLRDSQYPNR